MTGITVRYKAHFGQPTRRKHPRRVAPQPTDSPEQSVPTKAARLLALAHHVDDLIERGEFTSYAAAARRLGITGSRMNQILQLTLLAPDIQERVLTGELLLSARALRPIAQIPEWIHQRREVARVVGDLIRSDGVRP